MPSFAERSTVPFRINNLPAFEQNAINQSNAEEQLMHRELSLVSGSRASSFFCADAEIKYVSQIIHYVREPNEEKLLVFRHFHKFSTIKCYPVKLKVIRW